MLVCGRLIPGAYPDAPPSHLYRNDGGTFTDVTSDVAKPLLTAGMVTDALFTDADGDGKLDLLLAAHWQPIRLLHNDGKTFVDATEAAGLHQDLGWWNSLCAWDIDGDGDLDYVAGNQGFNTKYKATPDKPARLYFGDFDDDGRRDLIEAKYEGDRLLPVRGRSCSSGAMPSIATRFPTYEQFASSLLTDIYSKEKLATCGELLATQLASCLLRNDGKGHFTIEPLPHRAQIAPINAMHVHKDLLICAQNNFSPEPETGRHDGGTGLVLQATNGHLTVLPPHAHGLNHFGDQRALAVTPNGTLLFAPNNAPPPRLPPPLGSAYGARTRKHILGLRLLSCARQHLEHACCNSTPRIPRHPRNGSRSSGWSHRPARAARPAGAEAHRLRHPGRTAVCQVLLSLPRRSQAEG